MNKIFVDTLCNNCDSEFSISFNEELVIEHEKVYCPFCKNLIEDTIEDSISDDDPLNLFDEMDSDW